MKKSIIAFTLTATVVLFSSFSNAQYEDQITFIEKSLALEKLKEVFAKDEMNKMMPLTIVTNNHFSPFLDIDHNGKKVEIYEKKQEIDLIYDNQFVDVKKFKIRGNVSILKFKYQNKKVKVKLRKIDGNWKYFSLTIRGGGYYKNIDSTI